MRYEQAPSIFSHPTAVYSAYDAVAVARVSITFVALLTAVSRAALHTIGSGWLALPGGFVHVDSLSAISEATARAYKRNALRRVNTVVALVAINGAS